VRPTTKVRISDAIFRENAFANVYKQLFAADRKAMTIAVEPGPWFGFAGTSILSCNLRKQRCPAIITAADIMEMRDTGVFSSNVVQAAGDFLVQGAGPTLEVKVNRDLLCEVIR
jgi:hypothetical protein